MIQVDSETIGKAASIGEWITAMENAFRDTAEGKIEVPKRSHIDRGENTFLFMPCFGEKYFSTKLVSVFPENAKKKKPVIYGTVILNDGETGEPLAALDGSKLTAMRTAAVGSVGIKYLAPEEATTLGIIGLGIQGFHQALFACQQRPIAKLRILDRNKSIMDRFKERFKVYNKDVEVITCRNAEEVCQPSEVIITATGSKEPVVPSKSSCWKGKTLIGIGSYKPDMREFPEEIFSDLSEVFVDTMHGLSEAGDLVIPVQQQLIEEKQIVPVSELIMNRTVPVGKTRFFKSVGMAAFDLYGARLVYENLSQL